MGCISSKNAVSDTPAFDYYSGSLREQCGILGSSRRSRSKRSDTSKRGAERESTESGTLSSNGTASVSFRLSNFHRYNEAEQVAAGWPAWLSAVAGEAIQGWVPLKADSYEKLEKIGQGTYSTVFRARDLDTGKIMALKKVRFDNYEPESVKFMAREIQILRRLDHPNVVKLDGLITSRLSSSIYLVFDYMEHDLAGLLSCPDISFTESQVKCYMNQLLSGIDHCHSRGVMHRDIKCSNLLVSNEGILKIADFGLANSCNPENKQPLTSRVVTLWYRPPELLLGSTDYASSVDMWSVGCVFAEALLGKPILQGRTEVEQLHKIFKLCGSPPEEYWKKSRLPHATMFKPQHPYESCLRDVCKGLPLDAVDLIETLLSVEPYKRGSASSALKSEYFTTKPHACDPSSLPKYPPNKEIDAKLREEHRRRAVGRGRSLDISRRLSRAYRPPVEVNGFSRLASHDEETFANSQDSEKSDKSLIHQNKGRSRLHVDLQPRPNINPSEDSQNVKGSPPGEVPFSGPIEVPSSSGFAWARKRREDFLVARLAGRSSSKSLSTIPPLDPATLGLNECSDATDNNDVAPSVVQDTPVESKLSENPRPAMPKHWPHFRRPESFDVSKPHHSREVSDGFYQQLREEVPSNKITLGFEVSDDKVEFSGPLLTQSNKVDELLQKHERHIRQALRRRSWFQRARKPGK